MEGRVEKWKGMYGSECERGGEEEHEGRTGGTEGRQGR